MPALTKPPAALSRFVPHTASGASAGAGTLFQHEAPAVSPWERSNGEGPAQTLPTENPHRVAHDARNVLSGLVLYCELLAAPGVLSKQHSHYARDLETSPERRPDSRTPGRGPDTTVSPSLRSPPVAYCPRLRSLLRPAPSSAAARLHRRSAIQLSITTLPCAGCTAFC